MSLLTDEEIHEAIKSAKQVGHNYAGWVKDQRIEWGRAVQAAILAKLASAELPEPKFHLSGDGYWVLNSDITYRPDAARFKETAYTADQLTAWGKTRFAQGAASQLAEMPVAELMWDEEKHKSYVQYVIPLSLLPEGTQLYTRRQA